MTDEALLHAFVRDGSQSAFATLVTRHLDLVFSVARRKVRSSHLAEEVAQMVFLDLARQAGRIERGTPLIAWLHLVSRRTAIDVVRREARRAAREKQAAALADDAVDLSAMKPTAPEWSDIEPWLDEAVESLAPADRTAILLRYFENKDLREVGAALGTSDDAAQKRVSRALDQLRSLLLQRGVTVSTAGLATNMSAHALSLAPAGLSGTISAAATLGGITGVTAVTAIETSRIIAMTTLHKTAIAAAFVVVAASGIYQASLAARTAAESATLQRQIGRLSGEIGALRATRDAVSAKLEPVERQIDTRLGAIREMPPGDATLEEQMKAWLARAESLKAYFVKHPELSIPEMKDMDANVWFQLAEKPFDSAEALRKVTAQVRDAAQARFGATLSHAVRAYLTAHGNELPSSPRDLAPFCVPSIDDAILDRYEIVHRGKLETVPPAERKRIVSIRAPVDPENDSIDYAGSTGNGTASALGVNFTAAMKQFGAAHPGQRPYLASQLRPYLKWPLPDESIQRILERRPSDSR